MKTTANTTTPRSTAFTLVISLSTALATGSLCTVIGGQHQGESLSVTATSDGAELRCAVQRLEGQVTPDGLWLTSTAKDATGERFRVVAVKVGRMADSDLSGPVTPAPRRSEVRSTTDGPLNRGLSRTGKVAVRDKLALFIRPGLTEEYSVSADGVRQDFVVSERPAGAGELRVELRLSGVRAEAAAYGAKLTVEGSERVMAYSRLRVVDATGQELTARLELLSADRLAVRVADANALYPVRIDPTFSDANWVSMGRMLGANGAVNSVVVDEAGNLYIGGSFSVVGEAAANRVAKWDGSTWSSLGSGMGDPNPNNRPAVYALAVSGTNLYAGGNFTTAGGVSANYIARWDGSAWSALSSGIGDSSQQNLCVYALAASGTNLYVGGSFLSAGEVPANYIAKWDGNAWSALGSGVNGQVYALAVSGTDLYAGGNLGSIAKWDGSAWSVLGSGMNNGSVKALAVSGSNLYAAGDFTTASGVPAKYIAKWDGIAWSALGSGMGGPVSALAVSGTNLYAGGNFSTAGGRSASRIAKWDGSTWSALGSGMLDPDHPGNTPTVSALAVSGTDLYAGGDFTTAGGVPTKYIAKWAEEVRAWSGLGALLGVNARVNSLAVSGTDLYAAGDFSKAGGVPANRIAKWNGSAWSALGSGINGNVNALAVSGSSLYAGGNFLSAGGVPVNRIARWDGSAWSALGSGMNGDVNALAVSATNLYAGGSFATAGGVPANYIARWDGTAWSTLGSGMDALVSALVVSGSEVYAGGDFSTYVAKWDGSGWTALGGGFGNGLYSTHITALAVSGSTLYAQGYFSTINWQVWAHVDAIAKWDGSVWSSLGGSSLGTGGGGPLAVSGTNLYVGLAYYWAGQGIAKWDGSTWSAMGSGVNGQVYALAADDSGHLFVGGDFSVAGTNVSPFIAQANVGATPGRLSGLAYSPVAGFSCRFSGATIGQPYRIQTSPSLEVGSWTNLTNFTYTGPIVITDTSAATSNNRFYRAVAP